MAPRFVSGANWLLDVAGDDTATVHYETGPARARLDSLIVPIVMDDTTEEGLPRLVADLEISPLGPERSQLTLSAIYRGEDAAAPLRPGLSLGSGSITATSFAASTTS